MYVVCLLYELELQDVPAPRRQIWNGSSVVGPINLLVHPYTQYIYIYSSSIEIGLALPTIQSGYNKQTIIHWGPECCLPLLLFTSNY